MADYTHGFVDDQHLYDEEAFRWSLQGTHGDDAMEIRLVSKKETPGNVWLVLFMASDPPGTERMGVNLDLEAVDALSEGLQEIKQRAIERWESKEE